MSFIMSLCRKCEPGLSGSTTVLIYFLNESNFFDLAWTVMNAIVAKLSPFNQNTTGYQVQVIKHFNSCTFRYKNRSLGV